LRPLGDRIASGGKGPINSHCLFVYECRLSKMDQTLCAATFLARQRVFVAVSDQSSGVTLTIEAP
jgi:hypothetical protein